MKVKEIHPCYQGRNPNIVAIFTESIKLEQVGGRSWLVVWDDC